DHVALRIGHVDRRALAFRAVTRFDFAGVVSPGPERRDDLPGIERLDAQAQVVEIAALAARRRTAQAPELAVRGDQVDERAAGAHLVQPRAFLDLLERAAEH